MPPGEAGNFHHQPPWRNKCVFRYQPNPNSSSSSSKSIGRQRAHPLLVVELILPLIFFHTSAIHPVTVIFVVVSLVVFIVNVLLLNILIQPWFHLTGLDQLTLIVNIMVNGYEYQKVLLLHLFYVSYRGFYY